jgi:hypothetical protein
MFNFLNLKVMKNSKKFFLAAVLFAGLFLTGCDKNKDKDDGGMPDTGTVPSVDIDKIMSTSYSNLTPEQQKTKLEQESIDFLNKIEGLSDLSYIETFEYLFDLLDMDTPDVDEPIIEGSKKDIFDLENVFGVFTWDAGKKRWTKTNSGHSCPNFFFAFWTFDVYHQ